MTTNGINYGCAPSKLRFCPKCHPIPSLGDSNSEPAMIGKFPWAIELICPICKCMFTICSSCMGQRKALLNNRMAQRHHRDFHLGRVAPLGVPELMQAAHTSPILDVGIEPSLVETSTPAIHPHFNFQVISHIPVQFSTNSSTLYFNHHVKDGSGPTYLISCTIFHLDHTYTSLTSDDVSLNLLLAHLVLILPEKQRYMFCQLLRTILDRTSALPLAFDPQQQEMDCDLRYHITSLPTYYPALRRQFLEGKYAMFPNLPKPKIYTLGDSAYCLPSDCLQHHLSHGYKVAFLDCQNPPTIYSHPKFSPRSLEIRTGCTGAHAISALLWSDDCDPQTSKKHRKALWCLTITFIQDTDVVIDSPLPTYPLAVADSSSDHRAVLKIIMNDLDSHCSTRPPLFTYMGPQMPPQSVNLDIYAYLGDQPERRSLNCLMLGGSTHHARFRYSCNVRKLIPVLRACSSCEQKFLIHARLCGPATDNLFENCHVCTNWWLNDNHPKLTYKAQPEFPSELLLGGITRSPTDGIAPGMHRPIEITYSILIRITRMAHEKLVSQQWSKVKTQAFLNAHCINTEYTNEIKSQADACRRFEVALSNTNDEAERMLLLEEKGANPKAYSMAELPPLWTSNMKLEHFVDPPMHLVALGFVKTTILTVDAWMISRSRQADFNKLVRPDLYLLQALDLDWCEVVPKVFGGSYGGYVSDNYMAVARLSPWLYTALLVLREPDPYIEPDTEVKNWNATQCKAFLSVRGMTIPKKPEAQRLAVINHKKKPISKQLPILVKPICTAKQVFEVITRMYLLISLLSESSTNGTDTVSRLHVAIRLYLSAFDRLDQNTRVKRTSLPSWVEKYNLMCLLNLPETVKKFGPLKNLYEGKYCGESFNRILKPKANRGSHKNRFFNLLRNLHCEKAMTAVQHDYDTEHVKRGESEGTPDNYNGRKRGADNNNREIRAGAERMKHCYRKKAVLNCAYTKHHPLSVIVYKPRENMSATKCFGACYVLKGKKYICPLVRVDESMIVVAGMLKYWYWEHKVCIADRQKLEDVDIVDYAILLPMNCNPDQMEEAIPANFYTISTFHWDKDSVVY